MALNYTPGPWKRGDCDSWIIWAPAYASTDWISGEPGPEAVVVAVLEVPAWAKVQCDTEVREAWLAEADATANLIAAAPAMDALLRRLIKWDTDFPVNSYNGYAGLKELDKIIADAKAAVGSDDL